MSDFSAAFAPILDQIQRAAGEQPVYLVGGAVRDAMLGRTVHDLDVVLASGAKKVARKTADALGGVFYMLDEARDTARVIVRDGRRDNLVIDFSVFRASDLDGDLRARDFTFNAMALDLAQPTRLIDPLGGSSHLQQRLLVLCGPTSLQDDPARVLRALRHSLDLKLRIPPESSQAIRAAGANLRQVSAERVRDEVFRMLDSSHAAAALRLMDHFDLVGVVFPELQDTRGVQQSAPHTLDVWEHTLAMLDALACLFDVLVEEYNPDKAANIYLGAAVLALGRYRENYQTHFEDRPNPMRSLRSLLTFAALYHDSGKPATRSVETGGRVRFFEHEDSSAAMVAGRGAALALSAVEIERVRSIVRHHMRIHQLAMQGEQPTRRAIYRYFRATGKAGVDITLHSLADMQATYGLTLPPERWEDELRVCRALLEAYWEAPVEQINPPRLLGGDDLQTRFGLQPGKEIGRLLEELAEAQACGDVKTMQDAVTFIENRLRYQKDNQEKADD